VVFGARPLGAGRHTVDIVDIVAMPLAAGGGPPPPDPSGELLPALARALTRLHANMAVGPDWTRGVLGYVRDSRGRTQLFPLFDEDSDVARLDGLPVPPGPGHPLEQPAYARLLATWESRMAQVHSRTARVRPDWDLWTVDDDALTLCYDPVPGVQGLDDAQQWKDRRRFRCHPLGTFLPARQRFRWQTGRRPGGEEPFAQAELVTDWAAAHELALMSAAWLGAAWMFTGEIGDRGELLYAAVFGDPALDEG